jgi:hypothetical protein
VALVETRDGGLRQPFVCEGFRSRSAVRSLSTSPRKKSRICSKPRRRRRRSSCRPFPRPDGREAAEREWCRPRVADEARGRSVVSAMANCVRSIVGARPSRSYTRPVRMVDVLPTGRRRGLCSASGVAGRRPAASKAGRVRSSRHLARMLRARRCGNVCPLADQRVSKRRRASALLARHRIAPSVSASRGAPKTKSWQQSPSARLAAGRANGAGCRGVGAGAHRGPTARTPVKAVPRSHSDKLTQGIDRPGNHRIGPPRSEPKANECDDPEALRRPVAKRVRAGGAGRSLQRCDGACRRRGTAARRDRRDSSLGVAFVESG